MIKSDQIDKLCLALVNAQGEIKGAQLDSKNPYFNSAYSSLASVMEACMPALLKNGISVVQIPGALENGATGLTTLFIHISGQYLGGVYPINPVKNDPQAYGSALSYARRYCLQSMAGVVSSDDDAENSMHRNDNAPTTTVKKEVQQKDPKNYDALKVARKAMGTALLERQKEWPIELLKDYVKWKFGKDKSEDLSILECATLATLIKTSTVADEMAKLQQGVK